MTSPAAYDDIAAIATAPGRGGVAVVRVSGPGAFGIAAAVAGRRFSAADAGRFFYRTFRDTAGNAADRGLVLVFAAPHSYTGEDCVEFQGHGGSVAPRRVLSACIAAGARLARRGEFTMRAFLNGRIGIDAAEAVLDLVDARTARAADDALLRMEGAPRRRMEAFYADLVSASADMERFLDFDEGDGPPGFIAAMPDRIAALSARCAAMEAAAGETRLLREGVRTAICGLPNAGKSSLMNAILGEQRSIVSAAAGTTRDYIEESVEIDGWPVVLADTAGTRDDVSGEAEAAGVALARSIRSRADVVLDVSDGTLPVPPPASGGGDGPLRRTVRCRTKCDLPGFIPAPDAISVSSATGEGLDRLRAAIARAAAELAADAGEESAADDTVLSRAALSAVSAHLRAAADALAADPAVAACALRDAALAAGRAIGRVWSDDMLESLFSRFCVGK